MTDILPPAGWPNVRQLETNEFATGGSNGNMNEQAKSLAARSELLKQYATLPYESKTGGYALNERVQLATGDIVRSTIASNVNNPNENMTGWVKANDASQIFDESGKSQQEINDQRAVNVKDYFTKSQLIDCLTATPSLKYSDVFQAAVDDAIANGSNSIFIPFDRGERYVLDKTVNIPASGFAILGNRTPSYHIHLRGGRITADAGVTYFFNYGVGGVFDSNQLVINGVGFYSANRGTQSAVLFDANNNGPHRGILLSGVCARGMLNVIDLKPTTESNLSAATLVINNGCVFTGGTNVVDAKSRLFGLAVYGVQAEQGARFTGKIDGPVTFRDNMLEGQSNVINIDSNSPTVIIENNYMEYSAGDYFARIRGTNSNAVFDERVNFISSINSTDFYLLNGNLKVNQSHVLHHKSDRFSLLTLNELTLMHGSKINGSVYIGTNYIDYTNPGFAGFCDPKYLREPRVSATTTKNLGSDLIQTPFGKTQTGLISTGNSEYITLNKSWAIGDIVTVVALVKVDTSYAPQMNIYNEAFSLVGGVGQITFDPTALPDWYIMSWSRPSKIAGTAIKLRFATGANTIKIAAAGVDITAEASFKTFNAIKRAEVQLFNPFVNQAEQILSNATVLNIPLIATGQTYTSTSINIASASIGDTVVCTPNVDMQGCYWFARVSAANTIELRVANPTAASVTLGNVQWKTRVFK